MLSVQQCCSEVCSRPLEFLLGLCVFAAVAAGGAVESVASTSLAVLLIATLFYVRSWPQLWRQLTRGEHLVLFGFIFYFASGVLAYVNVTDEHEYVKHLGRYLRFFLVVPIFLLLSHSDLKLFKYLLAGAVVSGAVYLTTTLLSLSESPGLPAQGGYHHITFGDMAMLNAMFLATVLATTKTSRAVQAVIVVSIICLLYSSVMSQARGAWLALPFCVSVLLFVAVRQGVVKIKAVVIALAVLTAVVMLSPAKDLVSSRTQQAVHEMKAFQNGESVHSSVGDRLAMWDIALDVWKAHPIVGTGPGDFDLDIQATQAQGKYKHIQVFSSVHNIYLQVLATTGAIGFVALCLALVILPFRFFYRAYRDKPDAAALGGMVVITAFAVFGLTESWILRSPVVAVYVVYFVVLSTEAKKISSTDD